MRSPKHAWTSLARLAGLVLFSTMILSACADNGTTPVASSVSGHENPLLAEWHTEFELPPFDLIESEDYLPAFREAMEMGNARDLLAMEGEHQSSAARTVAGKGLTVRETERLVKRLLAEKSGEPKKKAHTDPDVIKLEQRLGEKLGAKVSIQQGTRGKGKMVIHYNSLDELDGIIDHIK